MRTLKLTIAYDGTDFAGWQRQAGVRTVQAALEDALVPIEGGRAAVIGAGRTDAGVHAAAQVASVSLTHAIAAADLRRALNAVIPEDVRVISIEEALSTFNARFDAQRKTYRYWIWNGPVMPPVWRRFAWHVPQPLAVDGMSAAAAVLVGEHDFAAFQASGSDVKTTVRRVLTCEVREAAMQGALAVAAEGRLLLLETTGTGFLRHMVRNIAGTLVEIGRGRFDPDRLRDILASRDRAEAGPTAPPHGLVLWQVDYARLASFP